MPIILIVPLLFKNSCYDRKEQRRYKEIKRYRQRNREEKKQSNIECDMRQKIRDADKYRYTEKQVKTHREKKETVS
jgi:hypothetical protein